MIGCLSRLLPGLVCCCRAARSETLLAAKLFQQVSNVAENSELPSREEKPAAAKVHCTDCGHQLVDRLQSRLTQSIIQSIRW